MPKSFSRIRRIESLIQEKIAQLIELEFHDAHLGLITVTGAKVTPDLSIAKIYITAHDQDKLQDILAILRQEAKTLRYQLSSQIELRRTPELHFFIDEAIDRGSRISKLLNENL